MSLPRSTDNSRTDEMETIFGNNSVEDVSWLCSLSEPELDMIISLKMLVVQRAKVFGQDQIAQKFDLKILRALGLIMIEYIKDKVKENSLFAGSGESVAFLDSCNLLKCVLEHILDRGEIVNCIATKSKKRRANRRQNEAAENQRKQTHRKIAKSV